MSITFPNYGLRFRIVYRYWTLESKVMKCPVKSTGSTGKQSQIHFYFYLFFFLLFFLKQTYIRRMSSVTMGRKPGFNRVKICISWKFWLLQMSYFIRLSQSFHQHNHIFVSQSQIFSYWCESAICSEFTKQIIIASQKKMPQPNFILVCLYASMFVICFQFQLSIWDIIWA